MKLWLFKNISRGFHNGDFIVIDKIIDGIIMVQNMELIFCYINDYFERKLIKNGRKIWLQHEHLKTRKGTIKTRKCSMETRKVSFDSWVKTLHNI